MRKIFLAIVTGVVLSNTKDAQANATEIAAVAPAPGAGAKAMPAEGGVALDANTASVEQLAGSGVSPEGAQAIVAGRLYATVVDLKAMLRETLSEDAATAALKTVFVPVNLNSPSREEIELIPGMTDRMEGEFLEYRAYIDMGEFNREIGKYVDEAEVARLRRYLTL